SQGGCRSADQTVMVAPRAVGPSMGRTRSRRVSLALQRLGPPRQFLPLPATAFVCVTFAVCRVARRTYIPARPVCNVDGPELLRLPGYEARGFLLIPV